MTPRLGYDFKENQLFQLTVHLQVEETSQAKVIGSIVKLNSKKNRTRRE